MRISLTLAAAALALAPPAAIAQSYSTHGGLGGGHQLGGNTGHGVHRAPGRGYARRRGNHYRGSYGYDNVRAGQGRGHARRYERPHR